MAENNSLCNAIILKDFKLSAETVELSRRSLKNYDYQKLALERVFTEISYLFKAEKDISQFSSILLNQIPVLKLVKDNFEFNSSRDADFLKGENVEVFRPESNNPEYYNYCPRDSVFVYGNAAFATPMAVRCRQKEYQAFANFLSNLDVILPYTNDDLYNLECIGNPDILALNEIFASFDAANIIKANENLLYLVSNSGNKIGADYLQFLLGKDAAVHTLENVYSYMHIDSTIAFLKEGLLLANPARIKDKYQLPRPFCDWDIIWAPEPSDIGHYPGICNASKWINMNLFSVNPNLVAIEEHQHGLRMLLEQKGIECAMLPMRQQRTLGGGFHCVTLDIERGKT